VIWNANLTASVRNVMHIINCAKLGSDVITGPYAIEGLLKHPFNWYWSGYFSADYQKEIVKKRIY